MKDIAVNRQAYRDYSILEEIECGIALKGSEVKSIRDGRVNLKDCFARVEELGVTAYNIHISQYAQASYLNVDSVRPRRLLVHKNEMKKLAVQVAQKGCTLIPLKLYFNSRGFVKATLAVCKGKKQYDKRDDIKRREADMELRRALKNRRK